MDKALGLILTNRHVVTPCPVVAEAVFQNREEVPVRPLYYDPIHDFGFFRFDPSQIKFMQIEEVPLAPEAATVGLDIRVVGNDSGEKISILSGTLARLDRDAPHYRGGYSDCNTFYLQAASGTKGGSSGSPVVDIHGRAVGLNAGGKNKAASAYYLPLERVVRALNMLRSCALPNGIWKSPAIPRGDLQAIFIFKGFDEVKRLGLRVETEAEVRAAQGAGGPLSGRTTGMLVVESLIPGGPADGALEPGDVLVRLDGAFISDFLSMEDLLDNKVHNGGKVVVEVERGGVPLRAELAVQDLHAVSPSNFLEVGGGSVHAMSYQQARNNRSRVGQVYVAEPGYLLGKAGCFKHCIITSLAGKPTPTIEDFISALLELSHGQRVPLEYLTFDERFRRKQTILTIDWNYYGLPIRWQRDDAAGVWNPTTLWPIPVKQAMAEEKAAAATAVSAAAAAATAGTAGTAGGVLVHRALDDDEGLPPSPRLASPRIQASCAGRPPRPPIALDSTADKDTPKSTHPPLTAPLPLLIPRQHSIADVPASTELEKHQAGVTGQCEDNRLQSGEAIFNSNPTAAAADDACGAIEGSPRSPFSNEDGPAEWRTRLEERLRSAMVAVDVEIPLVGLADGVHSRAFSGCGIIVHLSKRLGLVLVDRNTVSIGIGDIMLSLGAFPAEIPARVRFLHPLHNFSLLSFDPSDLSEEAARLVAPVDLAGSSSLRRGDSVELVCLSKSLRILHRTSMVTNPAMAVLISQADVPRFRAVHEEVIKVDQDFGVIYSGVLADRQGAVRALWGSYSEQVDKEEREWTAGLPTSVFLPWVEALIARLDPPELSFSEEEEKAPRAVLPPSVRVLDAELEPLLLSKAAQFGLPTDWVARLMALDPERRQVLRVRATVADSPAQKVLQDGNMVLAVAGQPVSSFGDVENIIKEYKEERNENAAINSDEKKVSEGEEQPQGQPEGAAPLSPGTKRSAPEKNGNAPNGVSSAPSKRSRSFSEEDEEESDLPAVPAVPLTIFRNGEVSEVSVRLGLEDGLGTDRLVHWCGAQLQAPHRAVRERGFLPKGASGVYISRWHHGSPAHRFSLYALHWIVEVNGVPTPNLDAFFDAVAPLGDGADVRLRVVHYETAKPKVLTLKTDLRYWPTWELKLDAAKGEWTRIEIGRK